jgi:hypothetical protein
MIKQNTKRTGNVLRRRCATAIGTTLLSAMVLVLGLIPVNVLAHEDDSHYDHSGDPHDTPHKAEPPTGGHGNLAGAATNPVSNLVQFQLQNNYTWDNANVDGTSNIFTLQPVAPIKLPSKKVPLLVTRTTLPFVSTPDLPGGVGHKNGFGDLVSLGVFLPKIKLEKQVIGLGWSATIPTAGDNDYTGSGKWQLGPSGVYLNLQTPKLQWGFMAWRTWSVADTSSGSDRKDVETTSFQPIMNKHFNKGWYLGLQDVTWNYNHKTNRWAVPIGPRIGKVTKFGEQPVNLFVQPMYDFNADSAEGPAAQWSIKLNLTLLFPT